MLTFLRLLLGLGLGTKETFPVPGPLVPDPQHPPTVTLRRGHDSALVSWEPGRIIAAPPAYRALRSRHLRSAEQTAAWRAASTSSWQPTPSPRPV